MKNCDICGEKHDKQGLEYCVAALVSINMAYKRQLELNTIPDAFISEKTADAIMKKGMDACDVLFTKIKTERNSVEVVILKDYT